MHVSPLSLVFPKFWYTATILFGEATTSPSLGFWVEEEEEDAGVVASEGCTLTLAKAMHLTLSKVAMASTASSWDRSDLAERDPSVEPNREWRKGRAPRSDAEDCLLDNWNSEASNKRLVKLLVAEFG
jgi:hypothetical protein